MYTYALYYAICTLYNAIYSINSYLIIHICYPRCYVKPFLDIRAMVRIMTLFLAPLFSYVYLYLYYTPYFPTLTLPLVGPFFRPRHGPSRPNAEVAGSQGHTSSTTAHLGRTDVTRLGSSWPGYTY